MAKKSRDFREMVSEPKSLIAVLLVGAIAVIIVTGSVNSLPLFSNQTGPTELTVSSFERLGSGCAEDAGGYARASQENGSYVRVTFIRTGNASADLAAWTERTSPAGADLSTFRVHIDSYGEPKQNASCTLGVQYRIVLTPHGGSTGGLLPDAHGTRILYLENGQYSGCSASLTSPLVSDCYRFTSGTQPDRTWANASLSDA